MFPPDVIGPVVVTDAAVTALLAATDAVVTAPEHVTDVHATDVQLKPAARTQPPVVHEIPP